MPEPASLSELFHRHRAAVVARIGRIVHDAHVAEDLAQEAFLRVRNAVEGGSVEHFEAFLHRTARNLAIDYHRQQKVRSRIEDPAVTPDLQANIASTGPSAEVVLIQREKLAILRRAMSGLPERARSVLVLSRIDDWSNARIAAHLGISERTVFNDLKHAIGHCRDALRRFESKGGDR